MDMLIAKSVCLTSDEHRLLLSKRRNTLHSLGPFSYLTSGCAGGIWGECLHNFVSAFEEAKVKAHEYLRCVENVKLLSGMLDKCIPVLVNQVQKYGQVLPTVLRNVECMQATLKSLVNISMAAFDIYKLKGKLSISHPVFICMGMIDVESFAGVSKICPLRLPQQSFTPLLHGSTLRIAASIDTQSTLSVEPGQSTARSSSRLFMISYPSLQTLTVITCIVACCIQLRSYTLSTHTPGEVSDPDFYNNLQSVLMQLLTTYTGLVPTIRSKSVRGFVSVFWISLLSIAGLVLDFVSLGLYFHDDAMAPLLGVFGNVAQAMIVLQLAICIDGEHSILNSDG